MRTMYDSLNPAALPDLPGTLVASYIDGENAPAAGWQSRFTQATVVEIARNPGTNAGQVGDVESTDLTPATAVDWVHLRRSAGAVPVIYCNASTRAAVAAAFAAAGEPEPLYWIADWGAAQAVPEGAVAMQYANTAITHQDYDESVVIDGWPSATPVPAPAPSPAPAPVPTAAQTYVVVRGDTLSGISLRAYGTADNWPAIWHANPSIANPDLIIPGEVILIPDLAAPLPTFKRYTVVSGDSLWAIAAREYGSGGQWTVIYAANKAEIDAGGGPSDIYPGLELVIPAA